MCFMEDQKSSIKEDLKREFLIDENKSVSEKRFGWSNLYTLENGGFRRKTKEEIAKETEEENRKIQKEIDTLKPIITTLQMSEKAISISELQDMNEDLKKRTNQTISAKLKQLVEIGVVKRKEMNKRAYFFLSDISQEEIDKVLHEAVSSRKIRGFL